MRTLFLFGVVVLSLGCDPDLPGRSCASDEDCFSEERCVAETCLTITQTPDADPAALDAGVQSDFGAEDPEPGGDTGVEGD